MRLSSGIEMPKNPTFFLAKENDDQTQGRQERIFFYFLFLFKEIKGSVVFLTQLPIAHPFCVARHPLIGENNSLITCLFN